MSDKKSLVAKLAEACDAVGGIEKKGTNQKQNYKYVRAADVAKAFRHELFERGIVLIGDEKELIQLEPIPTQSGGKLNMIGVKIEYSLLDSESPDKITATGYGIGMDSGDKAIYKAKTGALKYFLRGLGLIPDEKDDPENDADEPTFQRQSDGSFAKNPPPRTENVQKPADKTKKPAAPKTSKATEFPHGHNVPPAQEKAQPANRPAAPSIPSVGIPEVGANIHGVKVQDSDLPDNIQGSRLPTEDEAKAIRERLIKIKDKGYAGLVQWIIKKSGKSRTNDIPYSEVIRMVEEVEAAEAAGTLKQLLSN